MAEDQQRPKVIKLAEWRRRKLRVQSQEDYIEGLCARCESWPPASCSEADVRRLAEIQRQIILGLLHDEPAGEEEKPKK